MSRTRISSSHTASMPHFSFRRRLKRQFQDEPTRRREALEQLKQLYLREFVEDAQDGTDFDCDVLNALNALQQKYG